LAPLLKDLLVCAYRPVEVRAQLWASPHLRLAGPEVLA
jgi:hypothetical protein